VPERDTGSRASGHGVSLRAFGREIGVSDTAIRKAIKAKRLNKSLGADAKGRPCIADVELAKYEWSSSSQTGRGLQPGSQPRMQARGEVIPADTLIEAQRRATVERERKLRIENDVLEGRLVDRAQVDKVNFEAERVIRENMLNIPSRLAGELAAESDAARVQIRLDAAIRQALNLAADNLEAASHG